MSRAKKRKINELNVKDKFEAKRQKIEKKASKNQKLEEELEENSDLSENEAPLDYSNIGEFLAPHEKESIRRDPYNLNYLSATWTNETTLLKAKSEFEKWINISSDNSGYWTVFYQAIFKVSDTSALFKWRRVCKLTNALVLQSHQVWRNLFYNSRHWKLRHDIGNEFLGVDPKNENKANWTNVVPDEEIDWFGEYRRNHLNSVAIRKAIEEINKKLNSLVDDYGVVKAGVENPSFFEPGVTDEEIDEFCQHKKMPLTNDLREVLKVCNGVRFSLSNNKDFQDNDTQVPKVRLPTLTNISYGMSAERFDRLEAHGSWFSSDEEVEDTERVVLQPTFAISNPEILNKPARIELTEDDMASDSDEYIVSDQSSSCSDVATEEENDEQTPVTIFHKTFRFGEETLPGDKNNKSDSDSDNGSDSDNDSNDGPMEYFYDINEGTMVVAERSYQLYFHIYESMAIYLQSISDALDDPLAALFVTFDDYDIIQEDDCEVDPHEYRDLVYQNNMAEYKWWKIIIEIVCPFIGDTSITQRATKLLIGMAQDTITRCFKEAHSMAPNDEELQVETFRKAVAKLFPNDLPPVKSEESDVKPKTVKKKKKKVW